MLLVLNRRSIVHRGELLEQTLGDEGRKRDMVTILLHLFLSLLRTLESKIPKSGQHPAPGIDSAD